MSYICQACRKHAEGSPVRVVTVTRKVSYRYFRKPWNRRTPDLILESFGEEIVEERLHCPSHEIGSPTMGEPRVVDVILLPERREEDDQDGQG